MSERPSVDQRNSATFAALTMVLAVVCGFVALVAFVIPSVLWFVLVPMGLGLMMVLHYLLWGRWLTAALRKQEESVEASTAASSSVDQTTD